MSGSGPFTPPLVTFTKLTRQIHGTPRTQLPLPLSVRVFGPGVLTSYTCTGCHPHDLPCKAKNGVTLRPASPRYLLKMEHCQLKLTPDHGSLHKAGEVYYTRHAQHATHEEGRMLIVRRFVCGLRSNLMCPPTRAKSV